MIARLYGKPSGSPRRAMTLVEVLAVVVILGLLAGTLAVGFSGAFGKGKHELAKTGIAQVVGRLELLKMDRGAFPANDTGLAALTDGLAKPTDPHYVSPERLLDPWGRHYLYVAPGPGGHPYEVLSYGGDGRPGGDGEDADLSSIRLIEAKP